MLQADTAVADEAPVAQARVPECAQKSTSSRPYELALALSRAYPPCSRAYAPMDEQALAVEQGVPTVLIPRPTNKKPSGFWERSLATDPSRSRK